MSADPYSPEVRRLFADPAHAGTISDGVVVREDGQGVRVELSTTTHGDTLEVVRFRAWGCPHLIAASDEACRRLEGNSIGALEEFETAQIVELLGIPIEKLGRILVLEDAVRSLARALADR